MIDLTENGRGGPRQERLADREGCGSQTAQAVKVSEENLLVSHAGIARSLKFMKQNFDSTINIGGLAKIAGLSRRGFHKAFQKHTGHKPGVFLRRLRIEHARRLLMEPDMQIREVARQSGFTSTNTFYVAFQRMTGFSPKQFQRQNVPLTYPNRRVSSKPLHRAGISGNGRMLAKRSKYNRSC
jgi:transcriptional regulator GlxA family with amidase domain